MSILVAALAVGVVFSIGGRALGTSFWYTALLLSIGIPLGYASSRLQVYWQHRQNARIVDDAVKEFLRTSRQEQADVPRMKVKPETVMAQAQIEQELRDMEPMIVRSKVRFIPRPAKEDIQEAVQDGAVIVVRVPVPERWREKLSIPDIHNRLIGRCNAVLEQIDLIGGHPRVMLLADTCESKAQFEEKVYERFGG